MTISKEDGKVVASDEEEDVTTTTSSPPQRKVKFGKRVDLVAAWNAVVNQRNGGESTPPPTTTRPNIDIVEKCLCHVVGEIPTTPTILLDGSILPTTIAS